MAAKDLFALTGFRIGAGNPTYLREARAEKTTAPALADLIRAGASVRGLARTDEFAYSIAGDNAHYGTPPNAALPGALPGGSSSGAARAVALDADDASARSAHGYMLMLSHQADAAIPEFECGMGLSTQL